MENNQPNVNPFEDLNTFKRLFESLNDYVVLTDKNGIVQYLNRADYGFATSDIIGSHYTKTITPDVREEIVSHFEKSLKGEKGQSVAKVDFPDGSSRWFENNTSPIYSGDEIIGVIFISRNVTKSRELANEIKESENRFQKLVEAASDIIYSCDAYGNFTYMNPVASKVAGFQDNSYLGVNFLEVIREDYRESVGQFYQQQFKNRVNNTYNEFPIQSISGETSWLGQNVQIKTDNDYVIGFQALARDITERKQFEEMLIDARQKAEESSRAKEQFLSVMSHEIRTPLNAVIGLTNLLLEERPTKQQLEHLRAIKFSADSLLHIINDILDFSKIESGKIILENEDFNLEHLIEGIHNALSMEAESKKINLNLNYDKHLPNYVNGDSVRLNQILLNLISNSIKFTDEGKVDINVKLAQELETEWKVEFTISDTGIGIAKEKQKSIFESFTQASKETTRKYGGTGLGLTITKQLIDLHSGTIQLKSKVGVGTEFRFTLSFGKAHKESFATNGKSKIKSFKKFKDLNCLLVEDNKMNQLVAGRYLDKWGIGFDIAENGLEAIEKLKTGEYQFILMDLEMPDMDGYETTKHIRKQLKAPTNQLPIVAVTASAFSNVRAKVIKSGMNDYISKPFEPTALYSIIAQITNQNFDESPMTQTDSQKSKTNLIDLSYLKDASGGDVVFIQKMIETFIKHAPQYISNFQTAYSKNDLLELKRMAHKYKATVSIVGIKVIQKLIERLESNISKNQNIDELEDILDQIATNTELARQELNKEMERY